ncbi:thrombospondin type-1 domain-containing protein 7B-like [Sinocyclocheilus rhinocerous]|uniref:thrombospondin type-1 domain-containing protein 7B-like n=1 Tax=Sinocyclocheilus rhinocerous TaxID=307959 RepID=UPI0007B8B4A9|nr:PREDICTED: thrombospondin type-1 domain-containing protein 7B-like [Sinocyclocheilus rhinocerous]
MPCPGDCVLGHWGPWTSCSQSCSSKHQEGKQSRSRLVLALPGEYGKPCPPAPELVQWRPCGTQPCTVYYWDTSPWDPCMPNTITDESEGNGAPPQMENDANCGTGVQMHQVTCRRAGNGHVLPKRCPESSCPDSIRSCPLPCKIDCIVTPFSEWSTCPTSCLSVNATAPTQSRHRIIIQRPANGGQECPDTLYEERECDPPPLCPTYRWQTHRWHQCILVPDSVRKAVGGPAEACGIGLETRDGKPCPPAPELEQWRPCGTHSCTVYYWDTSPWDPCMPNTITDESEGNGAPPQMENDANCGTGVQMHQVTCRRAGNGHVLPKRCPESSCPDSIRSCPLPCKIDCIVTPFSEWSTCPTSCLSVNATAPTQSRHRIIIQRPANGGQECPDTLYEERECDPPPLCPTYRWQTHRWHQCILVPDSVRKAVGGPAEACGIGLETREVTCVGADDSPADVTDCLRWAGLMPVPVRECRVPCRDECSFTSWSRFTQCQGCGSWRTRTRSLIGRSKKRWRCQQEETFPLLEKEACPCSEFHTQAQGPWSPCLVSPAKNIAGHPFIQGVSHQGQKAVQDWRAQRKYSECGHGKRYRALACLDHLGRLVEPALCRSPGYEEDSCHVPCSTDCKLSEWSNWSACSASCGGGVKVRSQWLREKPFNGGRPCPKLDYKNQAQVSEVLPCYSDCSQYVWEVEFWSMCVLNPPNNLKNSGSTQPVCGEGFRTGKIHCLKKGGENQDEVVDDSLCDQEEKPIRVETCLLPCPAHCVTSEWSQWTKCTMDCNDGDLRWRSRSVLRWPEGDHTCPDLNQTQACINMTCLKYSYVYSDWSSCQLSENAVCGHGIKTRLLNCVRSDGKLVEQSMCKELGPSRGKLSAPCEVGCPVNCLITEWSTWSECQMTRSRVVLQPAGEGGRPCPSQLSQTHPCPIRPCYSWRLGDWRPCRVEGADCGEGVSQREISCVVHWGSLSGPPQPVPVEDKMCVGNSQSKVSETELLQPCTIPCPGECHLTKWSAWSLCQLLCLDGRSFETWGRQARSRAIVTQVPENQDTCPSQMYETRPCRGGTCLSYEWMTGEWRHNWRLVWCQRSDGVNVTGGCIAQNQPSAIRQCHPPCTKPFSFCTQNGVCGCEKGFTEVMTSHGFLDYCTRTPGLDHKKEDVKTAAGRPEHAWNKNHIQDWALQPLGPDGRVKLWVYGLMAAGFVVILLLIIMSFLLCKNPEDSPSSSPQKALALAYDGDVDM